MTSNKSRKIAAFIITLFALAVIFYWAVNTGSIKLGFKQLINGLLFEYDENVASVYDLRFPRIFIAIFGGAAMSVSGVLLQAVMKNPLADPGILGISSGAGFVALIIAVFFPELYFFLPAFAFCGGILACFIVYLLSWSGRELSPLRLILVGVAVNAMFMGLSNAFNSLSGGNFSAGACILNSDISMKTWKDFQTLVVYVILGIILAMIVSKLCNLLALEDKTVKSLGVNVNRARVVISAIGVLLASISTAIIGPISFLGLIVPHIARLLVGSDHRILIPYSTILGALCLLLADTVGRGILPPHEISPGIVMSVVGGPFFIILLRRTGKTYGR